MRSRTDAARDLIAVQTCMSNVVAEGDFLMQKMVDAARNALQEREGRLRTHQERSSVTEALMLLKRHERYLVGGYGSALSEAFAEAPESTGNTGKTSSLFSVRFDQLELMDDAEVQKSVETARAQQQALHAADVALAELNPLVSSALGLQHVIVERNPLRPDSFIRALQRLVAKTQVPSTVRMAWMLHMCDCLGMELVQTYRTAAQALRAQGIDGVPFAAAPRYALPTGIGWDALASTPGIAPVHAPPLLAQGSSHEPLLTVGALRELIVGDPLRSGPMPVDSTGLSTYTVPRGPNSQFSMGIDLPSTLDFPELMGMEDVDAITTRPSGFAATTPALLAGKEGAYANADDPRTDAAQAQSLGREVVSLLIDNITKDTRLMLPVQQAVRDLEPALTQLVMADPRFFSDRDHPARQLLEGMTERSLAYADSDSPGYRDFLAGVRRAVDALATAFIVDGEPFETALVSLRTEWADESAIDQKRRQSEVQELLQAEQRNLLAEKIAADMQQWPELQRVPEGIRIFLTGPWAQVIAQARLSDRSGVADPGGFQSLAPHLLWSAQPDVARNNVSRLTRLVPTLLGKLREGLRLIDYPPSQSNVLLQQLIALHQQAFRPAEPTPAVPSSVQESSAALGRHIPRNWADVPSQEGQITRTIEAPSLELSIGSWVELDQRGRAARCQLTWASPHGTLYLFTQASGETQSMSKRMCEKMAAEGALRVVSDQSVVDGALDSVAATAMRNTVAPD